MGQIATLFTTGKPNSWDDFFTALKDIQVPHDFLSTKERHSISQNRDLFQGWKE